MPKTPGRRWVRVVATIFPTVLTLAIFEGVLYRAFQRDALFIDNGVYPDNPRGYFKPCGKYFCVDFEREQSNGCSAPVESERRQILFVGDSFTFGLGVFPADAFPSRLKFPDFQRRNCAYPGNNVLQVVESFGKSRERGRPALTIYGMVLNDLDNLSPDGNPGFLWFQDEAEVTRRRFMNDFINLRTKNFQTYLDENAASLGAARMLLYSQTVAWVYRAWLMKRVSDGTAEWYRRVYAPGPRRDLAFTAVEYMARESERFLVALFPLFVDLGRYPFEREHYIIREQLKNRGVEVLDLYERFKSMDEHELIVYPTDRHPNEIAHRIAAEAIEERLRSLAWPPFEATPSASPGPGR